MLLKTSAVLWIIWGIVHTFAGIMTISGDTTTAIQGIADGVDASTLSLNYPEAAGAIINQHGWNLAWFGIVTIIGGIYIFKNNITAIFITAMVGGLADLGYFLFLDLGGHVKFVPGTVMTIVSSLAIILSFIAYYKNKSAIS